MKPTLLFDESKIDAWMPLSEMEDSPYQRNKHDKAQIKSLAKVMKVEGVTHPICITLGTKRICFGHGRKDAALVNKWTHFPVIFVDFGGDDEKEYRMVQSDNGLGQWSELDLSGINVDLESLGPFDIDLLGIKDFQVEPADKYADKDADAVPEVKETDIKIGDLFQLGNHRLLCGDATSKEDVERLMNGEKADMVYTDPPYGISFKVGTYHGRKAHSVAASGATVKNDETLETTKAAFALAQQLECKTQIWWGASYYPSILEDGKKWIVWDKEHMNDTFSGHELAWTNMEGKTDAFKHRWFGMIKESEKKDKRLHPTQKPVALAEWCLEKYKHIPEIHFSIVLDLFLGSGSTLIACEKTNRRCFGMEIDPQYVQVIIDRWEKFTGQKAVKI